MINNDKNHQFLVNNEELLSIEILLKKEDALELLLLASNNDNHSVCTLMSKTELQKCNLQIPLPCLGNFKLPGKDVITSNYVVNDFLLFLNQLLKIEDDKVLLSQRELKIIYKKICYLVANGGVKHLGNQLEIMLKLVDNININVKSQYHINDVIKVSNAVEFTHQEDLIINPINLIGIITSAKQNSKLLNNLGIKVETQKQKIKA